ncbi:hypothetical protein QF002_000114 [Paraburkholderia youngii]
MRQSGLALNREATLLRRFGGELRCKPYRNCSYAYRRNGALKLRARWLVAMLARIREGLQKSWR